MQNVAHSGFVVRNSCTAFLFVSVRLQAKDYVFHSKMIKVRLLCRTYVLHLYIFNCMFLWGAISCLQFEAISKVCGGSNLSTVLASWWIYINKCISLVRIRLQVRKARNTSTKFRKTLESRKAEKSLEISAFLVFSMLHLNWRIIMWCVSDSDAKPWRYKIDVRIIKRGYQNNSI